MKENRLRGLLRAQRPSVSTRMWSAWPTFTEALGSTGHYDYVEFIAEYAPFSQLDLENIARAAELTDMGTMIKVDFQNRGYVAQKAVAAGFQAVLFTDCHTEQEVGESVQMIKPDTPECGGRFGYPARRFIGFQSQLSQMDHARRLDEVVLAVMIEKYEAAQRIEQILSVRGVDMVQFGPSDYAMSRGWNLAEHREEVREAERRVIEAALRHGVAPRCEIKRPEEAAYYRALGVRHFSLGDQMHSLMKAWNEEGAALRAALEEGL